MPPTSFKQIEYDPNAAISEILNLAKRINPGEEDSTSISDDLTPKPSGSITHDEMIKALAKFKEPGSYPYDIKAVAPFHFKLIYRTTELLITADQIDIRKENIIHKIDSAINWILSNNINVNDPEVRDYLLHYSDMIDLTLYACKNSLEKFALNSKLYIEVYKDPEIKDEYLVLYIRQYNYDEDILDKIEDLSSEFENQLAGKSGWISVTTDFAPAK